MNIMQITGTAKAMGINTLAQIVLSTRSSWLTALPVSPKPHPSMWPSEQTHYKTNISLTCTIPSAAEVLRQLRGMLFEPTVALRGSV